MIEETPNEADPREEPTSIETWKPSDELVMDMNSVEKMKELIERVVHKRLDLIYLEEELFYLFMRVCVQYIISKRKWNACSMTQKYYEYVTVSDEAFAFLVLENNGKRYLDMANKAVEKINWSKPIYTDVSQKGARNRELQTRGWTSEGKIRYMTIYDEIDKYRDGGEDFDTDRKEDLAKYIISKETDNSRARKRRKKKTTIGEDEDEGVVVNLIEQQNVWNAFMKRTSASKVNKRSNVNINTNARLLESNSVASIDDNNEYINNMDEHSGKHKRRRRSQRNRMTPV
jgi:hypothetical protein